MPVHERVLFTKWQWNGMYPCNYDNYNYYYQNNNNYEDDDNNNDNTNTCLHRT